MFLKIYKNLVEIISDPNILLLDTMGSEQKLQFATFKIIGHFPPIYYNAKSRVSTPESIKIIYLHKSY